MSSGGYCRIVLRLAVLLALAGCGPKLASPGATTRAPAAAAIRFDDVTARAGIDFRHHTGAAGRKWMPETMGSGCALVDVDRDGLLDVVLIDSTAWPQDRGPRGQSRLFRNLGDGPFRDVTAQYGLPAGISGMGVAAGDYDNDGYVDLFITALNGSRLMKNLSGKRFQDVTAGTGVATPGWPTGAAWLDYNRDGKLDLFVCHYVRWTPATDVFVSLDGTHKSYARPDQYPGEPCQLLENRGGRFVDVSAKAGIASRNSKALGVALCDFDRDGWTDLAVSNDTVPNFLFHNQGNGTFKEVAVQAGVAYAEAGGAKAGMGIDVADYENNGRDAILITNFAGEQLSLYRQDESSLFMDVSARSGLGTASQRYLGFGALFLDADLDGWQDVFVANGHIQDDVERRTTGVTYAEPALLFRNRGDGGFEDVSAAAGALAVPRVARGAAVGDWDNDGDVDLLVTTNGGAPALLRRAGTPTGAWLRLRLEGRESNRSAIGASVRVRAGGITQTRMVRSGSSYLSQSDVRLTFGLGKATVVDDIEVRWPNGPVETFGGSAVNRGRVLVEGESKRMER